MKKAIVSAVTLLIALALILNACGCFHRPPEKAVDKFMKALIAGKFTKAEGYLVGGDLGINTSHRQAKHFYKSMFATLEYTIQRATFNEQYAEVSITVTAADMSGLFLSASVDAANSALGSRTGDKKFFKLLRQKLRSDELFYTTVTATVYLIQVDGVWNIDLAASSSFISAITGGMPYLMNP